jgi:hypothetical protein
MWLMTNQGLVSVVQDRADADTLLVRARQAGLLEHMLAEADLSAAHVWEDTTADYRYRCKLSRPEFMALVQVQISRIDYDNFKNSVPDKRLASLYSQVWTTMAELQRGDSAP